MLFFVLLIQIKPVLVALFLSSNKILKLTQKLRFDQKFTRNKTCYQGFSAIEIV